MSRTGSPLIPPINAIRKSPRSVIPIIPLEIQFLLISPDSLLHLVSCLPPLSSGFSPSCGRHLTSSKVSHFPKIFSKNFLCAYVPPKASNFWGEYQPGVFFLQKKALVKRAFTSLYKCLMYYYIFSFSVAPLFVLSAVAAFDQQRYAVFLPTHFFHFLPCISLIQSYSSSQRSTESIN